jgi:nucleotide-binding universal stress UspA family protein
VAGAIASAPCGVAVATRGTSGAPPTRVGVAFDGGPEAAEALEWAIQLVERTGGDLRIIKVVDPRHPEGTRPGEGAAAALEEVRRATVERVATEVEIAWGDPAPVLTEAGRSLDLLVLGARARTPLRRALLGSVSTDVLHHAHCPVVVLPRGVHTPTDTAAGAM